MIVLMMKFLSLFCIFSQKTFELSLLMGANQGVFGPLDFKKFGLDLTLVGVNIMLALVLHLLLLKFLGLLTLLFIFLSIFFRVHILHRFVDIAITLQYLRDNLVVSLQINLGPVCDLTSQKLHLLKRRSLLDLLQVELDVKDLLGQGSSSSELSHILLMNLVPLVSKHIDRLN